MNPQLIWLDDPQIFQVNRLPAHSDHDHFGSLEEIKKRASSMFQSLNGTWKFCYSACAGKRPAEFFKEDFDASSFNEMKVPCHIEMAGYDKIHYINTMYPWDCLLYTSPSPRD